jgi:hypothetical protein
VPDFNVALAQNAMLQAPVVAASVVPPAGGPVVEPGSYRAPMTAAAAALGMALAGGVGVAAPLPSPGLAMAGLAIQPSNVMAYSGDNLDLHMDRIMNYPVTGDAIDPLRPGGGGGDTIGLGGQDESLDTIYGATRTFAALMREREGALRNSVTQSANTPAAPVAFFSPSMSTPASADAAGSLATPGFGNGSSSGGGATPIFSSGGNASPTPVSSGGGVASPTPSAPSGGGGSTTPRGGSSGGATPAGGGGGATPGGGGGGATPGGVSAGINRSTGFNTDAAGRVLGGI